MSLAPSLEQELNRLALLTPATGTARLVWRSGDLQIQVAAVDAIGCAIDQVLLTFSAPRTTDAQRIRTIAEQLCRQLRYLVEPLEVLEVVQVPPVVQARSQPPTRNPQGSTFYELKLDAASFLLVRYHAPKGQPKVTTPMKLTREILARVVDDLVAAAEQLQ